MTDMQPPQSPGALGSLTMDALRAHRREVRDEEERVSYWRRLVQFRIDIMDKQGLEPVAPEVLVKSLGSTGTGARRQQLLSIAAHDPLPELPQLQDLWTAAVDPSDTVEVERIRAALLETERTLSAYRSVLHRHIDAANEELIQRYRANPELALDLLN